MRPLLTIALLLAMPIAGCAFSRESQIASALVRAGAGPELARCMATPMARDLSSGQIRSLRRLSRLSAKDAERMTGRQMLDVLRESDLEAETVAVVVRAGFSCFLRS